MIHRALFGVIERFIGVLLEHYAGAFPPGSAPVQVVAIPIAERHNDYLQKVARHSARHPGRGRRVRRPHAEEDPYARLHKVPFMVIAGDRDVEDGSVSFGTATASRTTGG